MRTQAGPGAPTRMQAGPGAPTRTQAGPGAPTRTQAGPGAPTRTQAGPGAPTRMQAGPGAPTRMQAGPGAPIHKLDRLGQEGPFSGRLGCGPRGSLQKLSWAGPGAPIHRQAGPGKLMGMGMQAARGEDPFTQLGHVNADLCMGCGEKGCAGCSSHGV